MQYKLHILIFTLLFALSFGASCSRNTGITGNHTGGKREVVDDLGRRVLVPQNVERVVSLAPSLTENVFAVGAGKKLVGVTSFCNFPEEAKQIQKVGDTMNPSLERIIALQPQLVLMTTASQLEAFTRRMEEQGIAVFVTNPTDFDGVLRNLTQIGDLLGTPEHAAKLTSELKARIETVESKTQTDAPVRVFVQISREPLFTFGQGSFVTDLIRRAGGISVTEDVPEAYPRYSDEAALAAAPEAIILPLDDSTNAENAEIARSLQNSPAAQNKRIYKINSDWLMRPSPRMVNALEEIARALHPNVFQ